MNICVAQTRPVKGKIVKNIEKHLQLIAIAVANKVNLIIFPELSLTGYEPEIAKELATTSADERFEVFQNQSDSEKITIGVGCPTKMDNEVFISMLIFQAHQKPLTYSKQYLYKNEKDIFTAGQNQIYLQLDDENIIAPAICYELSNPKHAENAKINHANRYIASVLNSINGIDNDIKKLSHIAKKHQMTVLMSNYIGTSGGNICAGKSSVWNENGKLIAQLDSDTEGLLIYNTQTAETHAIKI